MTPRTKFEKLTASYLDNDPDTLPELTEEQKKWAIQELEKDGSISAKEFLPEKYTPYTICPKCYRRYGVPGQIGTDTRHCPICRVETEHRESDRPRVMECKHDITAFRVYKGIQQIIRYQVTITYKYGGIVDVHSFPKCLIWINPNGKCAFYSVTERKNKKCKEWIPTANNVQYKLEELKELCDRYYWIESHISKDWLWPKVETTDVLSYCGITYDTLLWLKETHNRDLLQIIHELTIGNPFLEKVIKNRHSEVISRSIAGCEYSIKGLPNRIKELAYSSIAVGYKIACRHHYVPSDWNLWFDMVEMLEKAGKDIHNPKFVCPEDIHAGHDIAMKALRQKEVADERRYYKNGPFDLDWFCKFQMTEELYNQINTNVDILREIIDSFPIDPIIKKNAREMLSEGEMLLLAIEPLADPDTGDILYFPRAGRKWSDGTEDDNGIRLCTNTELHRYWGTGCDERIEINHYEQFKSKFNGLSFKDDELILTTLNSIKEYVDESMAMHNCIASMKYYLKPRTLILSARVNGKSVADVEVDLETFRILQCYGPYNRQTPYKDRISKIIANNIQIIKERMND